ncbi:glycosyltransferase family 4 protein [Roseomonas sp. CCTCC AB2023176]|uniref:glycosyltransferase family 4 protein n=1 Tax=Roseomonas sp. CCTCC AB2023176 TaxID=3342640 RepID=UPI0035DACE84
MRNGYALRVHNLLQALAGRWRVTLVSPAGAEGLGLEGVEHRPVDLRGPGLTYPWRFDGGGLAAAIGAAVRDVRPDRGLVWPGAEVAWLSGGGRPPAVMDMVDCNPLEFWRGALASGGVRERWRHLSQLPVAAWSARQVVRGFAAVTCVGDADAGWMARIGGRGAVHVSPNGVAVPDQGALAGEAEVPTLAFTGTLDYGPNVDAVRFAVDAIWPAVRAAVPGARFVVGGRRPVPEIAALHGRDGIEVVPDVPDMVPLLGRAWVAVAPMRTGVGIKNKVLEAWACGRPVVMTPMATNGLVLPAGHEGLVAARAEGLAEAVVGLLRDGARRRGLGIAARRHVEAHCTWAAVAEGMDRLLRAAGPAR